MPVVQSSLSLKEGDRYEWPARYVAPSPDITQSLREWRKQAVIDREAFLGYQRTADREWAKFFKQCAARCLKTQRACTFMLPWFGEPDANQSPSRPSLWPLDLADELDEVSHRIIMRHG